MSLFHHAERLRVLDHHGKEIYLVNYSGLSSSEMISLTNQHAALVVAAKRECFFIANYEDTFATGEYMNAAYAFTKSTKPFIPKGAFLGIYGAKVGLLKAVVYFMDVNFKAFPSEEEALNFLVN